MIDHSYTRGETYLRLFFNVPVTKNATDSIFQTLIPPLLFYLIAMISFFINVENHELISLRYCLTTSMFISAVMYHFSQLSMLPGLGVLKLFDKFMIAVYPVPCGNYRSYYTLLSRPRDVEATRSRKTYRPARHDGIHPAAGCLIPAACNTDVNLLKNRPDRSMVVECKCDPVGSGEPGT